MDDMPRIEAVTVDGPASLTVAWRGGARSRIDLSGWLSRPNPDMDRLSDPAVFGRAVVGGFGGMVTWDDGEGELAIDALHLRLIADEQAPFGAAEAGSWQAAIGVSDAEAADLVGVSSSMWSAYKAGAAIPATVARLCRAARRDPLILHAHLRPTALGRSRSVSSP